MARRKKGRELHGWLIVDKPAGMTSTSVVNKVRWALNAQKAGHAGTLDPDATGVLAVALGEATKTVPFITDALKCYRFSVRLGQATNTDDAEGEVLSESDMRPSDDDIKAALAPFRGDIMQVPPKFSAVKIDGERAYKLARDEADFEIAARPLYVDMLSFIERTDDDHVLLEMVCGKGGYVRAIARDLGAALGCFGHVEWLRREWSGPWDASDGITIEAIDEHAKTDALDAYIRPIQEGLSDLDEVRCTPDGVIRLGHGNPGMVYPADGVEYGDEVWASFEGRPVAVGVFKSGELHPSRVFNL
ncbi:tRNA pseudouridine(55) synthase TruB [Celeribacter marinus]|uniref:tRNA pseudouridine synthase B n=1 Tax=Celeribacter marinus TaxID=1397108 RepID=A0A0N9ZQG0_9RHOB|nr:tRNA pseudouridine(55) synthase TruB [Celeribacter marinus]ALI55896.1 tRNA pseudouridine synthase B [Celeribacter marinus]SFK89063.1 tRNA pseudouridine synthase B [Celeribacter marinus]